MTKTQRNSPTNLHSVFYAAPLAYFPEVRETNEQIRERSPDI
jgi:hypothetical protein